MRFHIVVIVLTSVLMAASISGHVQGQEQRYRVIGYYSSYSVYEDYPVTRIPVQYLTHLVYTGLAVSANGQCESSDEWADMQLSYPDDRESERLRGNFKQLQMLKRDYPNLQVLMSIGGWEYSNHFSDAALTEESRLRLVRSCVAFMKEYGFEGIDLDWRYPVSGGPAEGRPEDEANYTLLMQAFRSVLDEQSVEDDQSYLLTMSAPAMDALYSNIELDRIQISLDWINVMAFGFQGSWSDITAHHAPLYGSTRDPRGDVIRQQYNVSGAVNAYLDAGVPADKIVVVVAFYAQTWSGVRPNDYFGIYQMTNGVPNGTRPGGILHYADLAPLLTSPDYVRFFDEEAKAAWMYSADRRIAISYENRTSILNKVAYVRSMGLGGMAVWELSFDSVNHELLEAVSTNLNPHVSVEPDTTSQ